MRLLLSLLTASLALSLALLVRAQQESGSSTAVLDQTPEQAARALFERLVMASGRSGREPLTAFHLQAEVLTRSGVQSNEMTIDYRFLGPDCVRFMLPSRNETGRFGRAKNQYWLRSGEDKIVLDGREYAEDRRQVDDMVALAKNYVALTDPSHLDLRTLEIRAGAPTGLPRKYAKEARKLAWLELVSPDFALVRREDAAAATELYRVALGLGADDLPRLALIRPQPGDGGPAWPGDALLVAFENYQEQKGFRVPFTLLVHAPDPELPTRFLPAPSQEIFVLQADLRPSFVPDDFRP